MNSRRFLFLFLLFFTAGNLAAQDASFIEGKIIDKETKDPLPAYISVEGAETGCTADYDGHFKLNLKLADAKQKIKLIVWLIGYKKKGVEAKVGEYLSIELELEPLPSHEIVVTAESMVTDEKSQKALTMNKMEVYSLPGTAADPIYASQILPGVNSMPDASNMLIRGGATDEVAYFFDGIEIEHPFLSESLHESYFSIFDNQVIENFSVSTSGFHPKFGDALSGVMNIAAKENIFRSEGGLGISVLGLNSYAGLPIKKLGSFVGSYDRGHSWLMTKINNRDESQFETEHAFAKTNLTLSKSNNLRLLGLFDEYDFTHKDGFTLNSKNLIAGISWMSVLRKNLVTNLTLSRSKYEVSYKVQDEFQKNVNDNVFQARFDLALDLESHYIELGADLQDREIDVSLLGESSESYCTQGTRLGMYFNDKFRVSGNLYLNLGGRVSSLSLNSNKLNLDPRISAAYLITKNDTLRFSTGTYHQFGDYFILKENNDLKPKNAQHYSLSYDRIIEDMDLRMTLYTKQYRNLFLNEEGAVTNGGYGYARGAEFFMKKKEKKYDAIFVYNFLKSKRKETDVLFLARSPYEIDHSLTAIFRLKFNKGSIGIRYSYASGLPFTPLAGREWEEVNQAYFPIWGEPYSRRFPSYQRMDINGSKTFYLQKRMAVFYFGLTNVLNNRNVLSYEYSDDYSTRKNINSIFGRSFFAGIYIPFF